MKLTAIRLRNLKKFGPKGIAIEGIPNGLSVLAAPNEFGKSTLFEAVRLLLLEKHSANNRHTKRLRPWSNDGAPEIEIDVEWGAKTYRIWKKYLSGAKAQVTDLGTGEIVAQDGNADEWVSKLIGAAPGSYGPVGLLWVVQGTSMNQPEGGESLLAGLLEAEVGTLVGGDRARAYLQRARDELGLFLTDKGKPKAGPYKQELEARDEAADAVAKLEARAQDASNFAEQLQRTEARLRTLTDQGDMKRRTEDLRQAEAAYELASKSAGEINLLEARRAEKVRVLEGARRALADRGTGEADALRAADSLAQVEASLCQVEQQHNSTERRLKETIAEAERAVEIYKEARRAKSAADAFSRALVAFERRQQLAARLERAREINALLARIRADLGSNLVSAEAQARISVLVRAHDRAHARLDAGRPVLRAHLTDEGRAVVRILGKTVTGEPLRLSGTTEITLGALGTVQIETHDPAGAAIEAESAASALSEGLDALGCIGLDHVAERAAARRLLENEMGHGQRELEDIAPTGTESLAGELNEAEALIPNDFDPSRTFPEGPEDIDALETERDARVADKTVLERELGLIREELASLGVEERHSRERLRLLRAALGDSEQWARIRADLVMAVGDAELEARAVEDELNRRREENPDLETTRIARDRLLEAKENLAEQVAKAREDRGNYAAELRAQEAFGISEKLAEAREAHAALQARVARFEEDIAALQLLEETLSDAQKRLKQAYFEPVEKELAPLLRIVLGESNVVLSDAYQAESLRRGHYRESIDSLSGGTREQVAVLTRLAFGRLMARQGKPVPVFLDDALVYCDDDRLGAMFNALHAASGEVQCIVLTCHERAFQDLGGKQLVMGDWS